MDHNDVNVLDTSPCTSGVVGEENRRRADWREICHVPDTCFGRLEKGEGRVVIVASYEV